jgi:hypothetical protein
MAIWILEGDVGHMTRAVLVNSVTEIPLLVPAFEDEESAVAFLEFAGVRGLDVSTATTAQLDALHTDWLALPACRECGKKVVEPRVWKDECNDCSCSAENGITTMTRETCVALLEEVSIACHDHEPVDVLREAVMVNVADGTISRAALHAAIE